MEDNLGVWGEGDGGETKAAGWNRGFPGLKIQAWETHLFQVFEHSEMRVLATTDG